MTDHEDERSAMKSAPEATAPSPHEDPAASAPSALGEPDSAAPAEAHSADAAKTQSEPTGPAPEPASIDRAGPAAARPRSGLPLFGAAIAVGAVLAVGGAFALRHFDGSTAAVDSLGERVAALTERTNSIETKADASVASLRSDLGALGDRLGAAERGAAKAAGEANSALSALEKSFDGRLASLVRAPGEGHEAAGEATGAFVDLGPLQARMDAVEQKLGSVEAALAAPKTDAGARQDSESAAAAENSKAEAVAIVAESLLRKLERGAPFPAELAALDNLGVDQAELAPLRPFAAAGVIAPRVLAEQFAAVATPIAAADEPGEFVSIMDRLARDAARLVHVRRVGEVAPDETDVPALVAKIENALKRLDVDEAVAIWAQLPASAKAKSQAWGEAAKARLDALAAARKIEADAVATLGKPKS